MTKPGMAARAASTEQLPAVVWLTGLSGAGKTTLARETQQRLLALGRLCTVLDGDDLRAGLCRDLGFSDVDRVENIRRVAHVARLFVDAGAVVIVALISPFCTERRMARSLFAENEFLEVFVDAPLSVCVERDPKGLYARALAGELSDFTGIGSRYEAPECPDLHLDTTAASPVILADRILTELFRRAHMECG